MQMEICIIQLYVIERLSSLSLSRAINAVEKMIETRAILNEFTMDGRNK